MSQNPSARLDVHVVPAAAGDRMLKLFACGHLPPHLQVVSQPFSELAYRIVGTVPEGPERTVGLRKLLEAKDAIVRAVAIPENSPPF